MRGRLSGRSIGSQGDVERTLRILCCLLLALVLRPWCKRSSARPACRSRGPPPAPLPVFPATNWWNLDISSAPVATGSPGYIAFINNGGTRKLHPDFGGEVSPQSTAIYGMPYAVVDASQPKLAVTFQYASESDGVNPPPAHPSRSIRYPPRRSRSRTGSKAARPATSTSATAATGICSSSTAPTTRCTSCTTSTTAPRKASGWRFRRVLRHEDERRRPDGWTSADAAGLAIFPGLVRYDEAWNSGVTDMGHAFRVTVRSTNGAVYPASHVAGSTAGALPMGARLRLKASVNGQNPALRTSDPNVQKIFRAMQKYGLIVADNGSDMYVSGTFDTRWNNDILNPAFALLSASDFDVVKLGGIRRACPLFPVSPSIEQGRRRYVSTGTVSLSAPAGAGGAVVQLASSNSAAAVVPTTVSVAAARRRPPSRSQLCAAPERGRQHHGDAGERPRRLLH